MCPRKTHNQQCVTAKTEREKSKHSKQHFVPIFATHLLIKHLQLVIFNFAQMILFISFLRIKYRLPQRKRQHVQSKLQNEFIRLANESLILSVSLDGAFFKNWGVASNVNNTKTLFILISLITRSVLLNAVLIYSIEHIKLCHYNFKNYL